MKSAEERARELINPLDLGCEALRDKIIKIFVQELEGKQETRIKELTSMGESKTVGEAMEYCRLHGLSIRAVDGNLFQIAGALMDARKDQDKITRHACAESINFIVTEIGSVIDFYHKAHQAIMNVKAV